jgi:DNA-binding PucR family transcriptional regulator
VVYRLERISDMLGADLDDPLTRHRLWLAIEAARLLVPAATPATSR